MPAKQKWAIPANQSSGTSEENPPTAPRHFGQHTNSETSSNTLPRRTRYGSDKSSSTFEIPEDLHGLSVSGVGECLRKLNMDKLVDFFKDNLIDGEMLLALDDETLNDMGIDKFHRLKLKKFIDGWRPSF